MSEPTVEISKSMQEQAAAAGAPVEQPPEGPVQPPAEASEASSGEAAQPPPDASQQAAAVAATTAVMQQVKRDPVPFHPRDTAEMFRYAQFLANSNLIPRALYKQPNDILVVLLKGQDLGLTPMQAISGINVIDGKAEVGALMMVSMIRKSGMCEEWRLVFSDATRAVYTTKRRGDSEATTFEYTIEEAEQAGLTRKGGTPEKVARSPWNTQRRTMLRRRCQSFLAREVYPDICAGLYDHDELREIRELEMDLIRTGMEATRAGFAADAEAPPAWMAPPPVATSAGGESAPIPVEVIPAPPPAAPPPPAPDPLKARMKKRADAAKSAQPDLLSVGPPAGPTCSDCGVPVVTAGKCDACKDS